MDLLYYGILYYGVKFSQHILSLSAVCICVLGKETVEEYIKRSEKLSIVIRVFARSAEESTQLKHCNKKNLFLDLLRNSHNLSLSVSLSWGKRQ